MKRQKRQQQSILEQVVQIAPGTNPISLAIQTLTSPEQIRQFFEEYAASEKSWAGMRKEKERMGRLIFTYTEIKQLLHESHSNGQPYFADEARQHWDDALCWYQRLVEFASNGIEKEWLWDSIPGLVQEGVLAREDVYAALEKHLRNVIPAYDDNAKRAERSGLEREAPGYWKEREREAREALADVREKKPVRYRGIELAA